MNFLPTSVAACCLSLACNAFAGSQIQNIDRHNVELEQLDSPASNKVVVFENGARETLDTWDKVVAAIKGDVTVFAYNRPGYGQSDETNSARDGRTVVEELRKTLRQRGLKPPYVLVGHSLGGLYMQFFARTYPDEVAGLVLVDSLYPGVVKRPEEFPLYARIAKSVLLRRAVSREIDQIHTTGEEVLGIPMADRIPVERLINIPTTPGAIAVDFGAINYGPELIAMINGLYPNAKTTVVDSDHKIQVQNPEVVVAAIRRITAEKTANSHQE